MSTLHAEARFAVSADKHWFLPPNWEKPEKHVFSSKRLQIDNTIV